MRILVADDEPFIGDLLAMVLKSKGHKAKVVLNGASALAAFENGEFELVITDLSMPEIDGLTLAREIKARKPTQAIALLTGSFDENVSQPNVDYILAKPVEVDKLTELLNALEPQRG
ncbi:MAG: response regulator [Chthoniobacter sp.]